MRLHEHTHTPPPYVCVELIRVRAGIGSANGMDRVGVLAPCARPAVGEAYGGGGARCALVRSRSRPGADRKKGKTGVGMLMRTGYHRSHIIGHDDVLCESRA